MESLSKRFIAIIPARGGSKRFPDKNIYTLNGKPLIAYSIEYAKQNHNISETYVTTDSSKIAAVAEKYGARVIHRPEHLATDLSTTVSALQHTVKELIDNKIDFDYIVLLQPTNPLRPQNLLDDAINIMRDNVSYDSLVSVSLSDKKLGKIQNGQFIPWNYKWGQRSQDLEPLYYENGLLYISKKELVESGTLIGNNMYPMIIDHYFAQIDIDTKENMDLAEYYLKHKK